VCAKVLEGQQEGVVSLGVVDSHKNQRTRQTSAAKAAAAAAAANTRHAYMTACSCYPDLFAPCCVSVLCAGLFARLVKLDPANEKNIRKAFKSMPAINACGFV
jgi:thioesterase domain-containing protein